MRIYLLDLRIMLLRIILFSNFKWNPHSPRVLHLERVFLLYFQFTQFSTCTLIDANSPLKYLKVPEILHENFAQFFVIFRKLINATFNKFHIHQKKWKLNLIEKSELHTTTLPNINMYNITTKTSTSTAKRESSSWRGRPS